MSRKEVLEIAGEPLSRKTLEIEGHRLIETWRYRSDFGASHPPSVVFDDTGFVRYIVVNSNEDKGNPWIYDPSEEASEQVVPPKNEALREGTARGSGLKD